MVCHALVQHNQGAINRGVEPRVNLEGDSPTYLF